MTFLFGVEEDEIKLLHENILACFSEEELMSEGEKIPFPLCQKRGKGIKAVINAL